MLFIIFVTFKKLCDKHIFCPNLAFKLAHLSVKGLDCIGVNTTLNIRYKLCSAAHRLLVILVMQTLSTWTWCSKNLRFQTFMLATWFILFYYTIYRLNVWDFFGNFIIFLYSSLAFLFLIVHYRKIFHVILRTFAKFIFKFKFKIIHTRLIKWCD